MRNYLFIAFILSKTIVLSQVSVPYFDRPFSSITIPSKTIFGITQTENGYIYLGSDEGLVRYNGLKYELLEFERKGKALNNLIVDGNDLFGLTFAKELIVMRNDTIKVFGTDDFELQKTSRLKLIGDTLFVLNKQGLQLIDKKSMQLIGGVESKSSRPLIWDVFDSSDGELMVLQEDFHFQELNDYLITHKRSRDTVDRKLSAIPFGSGQLIYDFKNNVFYTFQDSITVKKKWKNEFLENQKVHSFQNFNDELILISTYNGLFIMNSSGELCDHIFEGIPVSKSFKDQENNIWITTLNDAVYIIPDINSRIIRLEDQLADKDKVFKTSYSGSELLLGTHQGWVLQLNLEKNTLNKIKLQKDSEIQSIARFNNKVLVYCEKLYTLNSNLKALDSLGTTATKDILFWKGAYYYATSIGLTKQVQDDTIRLLADKWIRSVSTSTKGEFLIANTDFGYYKIDSFNNIVSFVEDAVKYNSAGNASFFLKNRVLYVNQNGEERKLDILFSPIAFFSLKNSLFVYSRKKIVEYDLTTLDIINTFQIGFELAGESIINCFATEDEIIIVTESTIQFLDRNTNRGNGQIDLCIRNDISIDKLIQIEHAGRLKLEIDVLNAIRQKGACKLFYAIGEEWIEVPIVDGVYRVSLDRLPSGKYPISLKAIGRNQNESEILVLTVDVAFPYWQKWWFFLLVGSGILLIVGLIFKYRVHRIQLKNEKEMQLKRLELRSLNSKLEALRSQMNPHFIFNTINTIQAQIISADKDEAYDNLNTFSKLIRSSLEHSTKNFIPIKDDEIFLSNYLKLESIRFNNTLNYTIEMDDILKDLNPQIPSLITQPFVENAVKHGLMHKSDGEKELHIAYRLEGQELSVEILDNGIGRVKSAEINERNRRDKHVSYATGAIEKRLEVLRDLEHKNLNISISDLKIGTRVLITMDIN